MVARNGPLKEEHLVENSMLRSRKMSDHGEVDAATSQLRELQSESSAIGPVVEPELLLHVSQVRRLLNRGRARIYEMCATGELESIRDGRSILIPREAVEAWIKRKRAQHRKCNP